MKLFKISLVLAAICLAACNKKKDIIPPQTPPVKTVPNVVVLGSSSAAGEGANPIDSSWVNRVIATVSADGIKANFTNLAVPGYVTYQAMPTGFSAASRPAPDTAHNITKALSLKPTLVLISFPTNDIADNYTDTEILANYAKMTHMLDSANVQYIIFSTQPRNFPTTAQRLRLKTFNDEAKAVYTSHYNDFLDQLSNPDYSIKTIYSAGDGIHLNNAGHAVIYNATITHTVFESSLGLK
jgi:acyl-CoA thioesterase-1